MRLDLLVLFLFVGACCAGGEGGEREEWNKDRGPDDNNNRGEGNQPAANLPGGNLGTDNLPNGDLGDGNLPDGNLSDGNLPGDLGGGNIPDGNLGNRRDEDRNLYYPCDFEDDIDCIRHYFASSGQCKEVHNYGNKPVYRNRLVAYLPGFNLTLVLTRSRIKYIRDRISRFYINKKTENLVMAVDFEGINVDSRYTYFIYQRRGQEPIKRADFTNGTLPVTLTAVIPLKKGIDFKESRVTGYLSAPLQNVQIGPKVVNSTDPVVLQVNTAVLANLNLVGLELLLTEAPSLYFGYLQKYICDFNIPINS